MAHAGVIVGAAVDGVLVEDVDTTAKTFPGLRRLLGGAAVTGRYSEHDHEHYERPRRRTRPRTKERPSYDDAVEAVVVTVDRGRYTLLVEGRDRDRDEVPAAGPQGRRRRRPGARRRRRLAAPTASLARIVEVDERTTTLRRTADDDDPVERVIVSNADQLVVVTALADPEPRTGLIDRALVAAYDARHDAAPVPHQGGPRRPGDPARDVPPPRRRRTW